MAEAMIREEMSDEERERNESGRYVESVTPETVLDLFEEVEGPALTSGDVRDRYNVTTDTAKRKLQKLEQRGLVGSRVSSGRTIYWRTEDEDEGGETA